MLNWFKELEPVKVDTNIWKPFIQNEWFNRNFMFISRILQFILIVGSILFGVWDYFPASKNLILVLLVFVVHEGIHIITIYRNGNVNLTRSKLDFWIYTDKVLTKTHFWIFMTAPILILSAIPVLLYFCTNGILNELMLFIAWVNLIIARTDIINSILILLKPSGSVFCRGYYYVIKKHSNKYNVIHK
ncbi:MAG TPA: DUF3267 domain-containing protein [Clostridiales bacterium]|nr:DUF3267 domain-containing protein [Clostridiales bacterium]